MTAAERRERFVSAAIVLLRESGVKGVRKWRSGTTGCAWRDGTIESPMPVGPVSFGTLAHECGHVALGHQSNGAYARWREETDAWEYALRSMQSLDLPGYERVEADAVRSVGYSYAKAIRRRVDPELIAETFPVWWGAARRESTSLELACHHRRDHL